VVSEAIELAHADRVVRAHLIEIQRRRLRDFSHDRVVAQLQKCLQNLMM